jgi:hypothetical protein
MNPFELYKKLPGKNCGQCRQKTCMPFALAVISGGAELSECALLTGDALASLEKTLTRSDWREELILKLGEEVRTLDLASVAPGLGGRMQDGRLVLGCLGRDFEITQEGHISTGGRITPWMKILLLHYVRTAGSGGLAGRWVSYSELRGGMVKISSFQRDCEDPLRELFDRNFDGVSAALRRLGAEPSGGFPSEHAWRLTLLPRIPAVILYWPEEGEFASRIKILLDASADRFLDAESLIFLGEGLVKNIEAMLS